MRALEPLSAQALEILALLSVAEGPHTPQRWSPRLWAWLAASVAAEQGRRSGRTEDEPSFPLEVLDPSELDPAIVSVTAALDAQKRVVLALAADLGRDLTDIEEQAREQLEGFFRALAAQLVSLAKSHSATATRH